MTQIYKSEDTLMGLPLVITGSDDQICVVSTHPQAKIKTITILPGEEAMKMAFAIAEHFSGEKIPLKGEG